MFRYPLVVAFSTIATFVFGGAPAFAGCHLVDCVENVYVTRADVKGRSCEDLWVLRNSIYKDAGYCFATPKASQWFGNEGCSYTDERLVPLNDYQRKNVDLLTAVERERGC